MKITQFLLGFLCAGLVFMIVSATKEIKQAEETPRYHVLYSPAGGTDWVIYDAVSGEYKKSKQKEFMDNSNLKHFLVK